MRQNKYAAFISYSSHDVAFAERLQEWLEQFPIPRPLIDGSLDIASRLRPVFRDVTELPASEDLFEAIRPALEVSRTVIVIGSEHAATSKWVDKELSHFRSVKPDGPILVILAPGTVYRADDLGSVLPPTLHVDYDSEADREPLVSVPDVEGEQTSFLRLAAGMLGVAYSVLADRHAERERRVRRQRSRLAAKVHTPPAEAAFLRGDIERALQHALAAVLEGEDPTWAEAPELESTAAEYAARYNVIARLGFSAESGEPIIIDKAVVAGRLLIVGARDGRILMADAQNGRVHSVFDGADVWNHFEHAYSNSQDHKWSWFRRAWDRAHPVGHVVASPSHEHLVVTHGTAATSWRVAGVSPTGLFLGGSGYTLFAFSEASPLAALANDASGTSTRIVVIDRETGNFATSEPESWEPINMAFSAGPWGEDLLMVTRRGTLNTLDPYTAQLRSHVTLRDGGLFEAMFLNGGRALRVYETNAVSEGSAQALYFRRGDDGQWRPARDPVLSKLEGAGHQIDVISPDEAQAVIWHPDEDRRVLVDASTVRTPTTLDDGAQDPTFSPDSRWLAVRTGDGTVDVIDAQTVQRTARIEREGAVGRIPGRNSRERHRRAWSSDGRLVAVSFQRPPRSAATLEELVLDISDRSLTPRILDVYDAESGRLETSVSRMGIQIDLVGFTPASDGVWVLVDTHDLRLVRVGEPRLVWSRRASDGVDELTFNLKGTAVAVVEGLRMGKRRTVRLMCAVSGETTATVDMDADVWRLDSLSDAELVLSCGDGTVRLCDSVDLEEIARFRDHADGGEDEILLSLMAMDPGRTVVVTATGEDVYAPVVARGLRLGTQGTMTMSPPSDVTCIAVSPDGGSFAYSIMGGWSFVQWRGSGGQLVRSDRPVDVRAVAIAIDEPNGCFIVVGAFGELQTFGLDTGRLESFRTIQLLNQEYGLDAAVVLAEQGRVVVVEERMVQLVRFNSDDTVALRTEEAYAVPPVVSSPDGSLVATASSDAAIRLWRTTDGRRVSILRRHRDAITGLRFSSDGQRLISADEGGVVCAWDVSDAYLRGAELTEWIRNRTGEGVLFLEENEDLLLRDVLREGDSRDVIGALDRLDQ